MECVPDDVFRCPSSGRLLDVAGGMDRQHNVHTELFVMTNGNFQSSSEQNKCIEQIKRGIKANNKKMNKTVYRCNKASEMRLQGAELLMEETKNWFSM
jgi:hypothetical protein